MTLTRDLDLSPMAMVEFKLDDELWISLLGPVVDARKHSLMVLGEENGDRGAVVANVFSSLCRWMDLRRRGLSHPQILPATTIERPTRG